ncbi:hypothetical protein HYS48_00175 [Candidatus Woesearchaeota archaeon]|nr:hypothetical protein [Candidatus Woesearchaeota archaeon]
MARQLSTKALMILVVLLMLSTILGTFTVLQRLQEIDAAYEQQSKAKLQTSIGIVSLHVVEYQPPPAPTAMAGRVVLTVIED